MASDTSPGRTYIRYRFLDSTLEFIGVTKIRTNCPGANQKAGAGGEAKYRTKGYFLLYQDWKQRTPRLDREEA